MHLLITTGDFSRYLAPNFHHLLTALSQLADITVWHESGDIREIIGQLDRQPDFVFMNEFGETNSPVITGFGSLSIPYAVLLHDLHYQISQRSEALRQEKVPWIFSIYRDKFLEWYPEFSTRLRWLPHQVNTDIFKDYGLERDIDWLFMGAVHPVVYPLRYKILSRMKDKPGFFYYPHPGYRNYESGEEALVGEKYARTINRAKMFITCDSRFHYPLAKYYEVLACRTLLLAPSSPELLDLGFIPGVHFAAIDENNFEEKAKYYLHHEQERLEIAGQGYEMVRTRHSSARRTQELVQMIEEIRFQ